MTDDLFIYYVKLPNNINEMVTPCIGGYTIYIDERLDKTSRIKAYMHAIKHIINNDFEKDDVQEIENTAHM